MTIQPTRNLPLSGTRILDMSSVIMGPYATQMLADYGAEVIAIEPLDGNKSRLMGAGPHPELSGIALNLLRGKRSVSIDMKHPAGRRVVLAVAAGCDAVVTNLRPGPLRRLQLGYDEMRAVRPDIIFCQAHGFRSDGPRAEDPAYDDVIQSLSGLADANLRAYGRPYLAPTIIADKICGMTIVQALLIGLLQRAATGCGQRIEVPMADVMTAFTLVEHGAGAIADDAATAGYVRVLSEERGPQETADGWINIMPYSQAAYDAIFAAGGRHDLVGDMRTAGSNSIRYATELYRELRPIVRRRTTAQWLDFCGVNRIPVGEVVSLDTLVSALPHAEHPKIGRYRTIPAPIWFDGSTAPDPAPAPLIGQDTLDVLAAAGLSATEIAAMVEDGVVRGPAAAGVTS